MSDNCAQQVLLETLDYFGVNNTPPTIATVREFLLLCNLHNLKCTLLHPANWLLRAVDRNFNHTSSNRPYFTALVNNESGVLVHHATAFQLYKIAEPWTHFVCEFRIMGRRVKVYDPYEEDIEKDYSCISISKIDYDRLFFNLHLMIFVQEK